MAIRRQDASDVVRVGSAGFASAVTTLLAGKAAPVAVVIAVITKAMDLFLARAGNKGFDHTGFVAAMHARFANQAATTLSDALIQAANLEPRYRNEIERLAEAVNDPSGAARNELLRTAIQKLFLEAGQHSPPSVDSTVYWPAHWVQPGSQMVPGEFHGRSKELAILRSALPGGETNIVCVIGLPGQGKSSLLARWYHDNLKGLADKAVFWCRPYETGYTFARFLPEVLDYLTCGQFDPKEMPDPSRQSQCLCQLLRRRPTLLVLDGVERWLKIWQGDPDASGIGATQDDRAAAEGGLGLLLRDAASWVNGSAIALTSRAIPSDLDDCPKVLEELAGLDEQASIALLRARGVQGKDDQLARAAWVYENHPLALNILGSLLAKRYGGKVERVGELNILSDDRQHRLGHLLGKVFEYMQPQAPLLNMVACCLVSTPVGMLAALLQDPEKQVLDALEELADWHVLGFDGQSAEAHALIRRYLLDRLPLGQAGAIRCDIARWFAGRPIPEQPQVLQDVLPLVRAVEHALAAGNVALAAVFMYGTTAGMHHPALSAWLQSFGYLSLDVELATGAIELYEALVHKEGRRELRNDLASAYNNRGNALGDLGQLDAAVADLGKAIEIREALVHKEGRRELRNDLASVYNNRGVALDDLGQSPAAVVDSGKALDIYEALVNEEGRRELRKDLASTYNNRGVAKRGLGQLGTAVADFGKALELYETLVYKEGRRELRNDLAKAYNNRGVAKRNLGQLRAAVADYGKALELYETLVYKEGRRELRNDLAGAYNNRGVALRILGQLGAAVADGGKAIEIREALLHQEGRRELTGDLESALFNQAQAHNQAGRTDAARKIMTRGASLLGEAIERGRLDLLPSFLQTAGVLAGLLAKLGEPEEAANWANRALRFTNGAIAAGKVSPVLRQSALRFLDWLNPNMSALSGAGLDTKLYREVRAALDAPPESPPAREGQTPPQP